MRSPVLSFPVRQSCHAPASYLSLTRQVVYLVSQQEKHHVLHPTLTPPLQTGRPRTTGSPAPSRPLSAFPRLPSLLANARRPENHARFRAYGRECAAHLLQWLKDNPEYVGSGLLSRIARDIDFSDQPARPLDGLLQLPGAYAVAGRAPGPGLSSSRLPAPVARCADPAHMVEGAPRATAALINAKREASPPSSLFAALCASFGSAGP